MPAVKANPPVSGVPGSDSVVKPEPVIYPELRPAQRRLLYELRRAKQRPKHIHGYIFDRFYRWYLTRNAILTATCVLIIWLAIPVSWLIPIKVAAMLFAVDQVRVFVDMSNPSAYLSWMIWPR